MIFVPTCDWNIFLKIKLNYLCFVFYWMLCRQHRQRQQRAKNICCYNVFWYCYAFLWNVNNTEEWWFFLKSCYKWYFSFITQAKKMPILGQMFLFLLKIRKTTPKGMKSHQPAETGQHQVRNLSKIYYLVINNSINQRPYGTLVLSSTATY